jgi:type IV pilus assembly protein PilN
MIEINLLPVREARRKADIRQQLMQVLLMLIVVAAVIGFVHSHVTSQMESTQRRIYQMEADIKQFQPQLDQVAAFRKKKANLEKKIDVIDGLDRARRGPVRVLDELSTHAPERLWLTSLQTNGTTIQLKGESLDNELVAVLLHALGESPYFDKVDLDKTELAGTKDGLKVVSFALQAEIASPKPTKAKDAAAGEGDAAAGDAGGKAKGKGKAKAKAKGKARQQAADESVEG